VLSKTTPSVPCTNDNVAELLAVKVLIGTKLPSANPVEVTSLMLLLLYLTNIYETPYNFITPLSMLPDVILN
jgi:hypothetical protein